MIQARRLSKATYVITCVTIFLLSSLSFGQKRQLPQASPLRPNLGTASTYAIFTGGGAINNTGLSKLTGDVGQDGAYAFNGFPPGTYTGALNRNNGASALAKADLLTAWTTEAAVPCGFVLGAGIVNGQSFDPAVYCSGGAATTTGNITFDAHGDANAIFIVKIGGQLDANAGTHILLANNAVATNIYWFVDGAVNIADNSTFAGVIVARGAITFLGTSSLDGRALTTVGAINISANSMGPFPPSGTNTLVVTHPAQNDTIKGGTQNYQITWTGSGITSKKIFEYSLDSGMTWKLIDTFTTDQFSHNWNVPDTTSKKALVRITDANNLKGISGLFTISSSKSPSGIIIVRPTYGEIITGGTQNYPILWTGAGIASMKTFELSLDSGKTWKVIGAVSSDVFSYNWNVPDTASKNALIRITDGNNLKGISGLFSIISSKTPGGITVIKPAAGEIIPGGTQNYQITWTGTGLATQKMLELSLDGGLTWTIIGFTSTDVSSYSWNVPDTSSTQAIIRITDQKGNTGKSGVFTIKGSKPNPGSIVINRPALDEVLFVGTHNYQIMWSGTGITPEKTLELSTNGGITWILIANISTEGFSYNWDVPNLPTTNAHIRITDHNGLSGISSQFTISSNASVSSDVSMNGYSVSNYPNPTSGKTTIHFVIPVASDVNVTVVNVIGNEVANIPLQSYEAGNYNLQFDASKLSPGLYTYILHAGSTKLMGKMSIIK